MLKKLMMIILSVILASVSFSCRDNVLDGDTDDIDSDVENGADNDNPGSTNTKKLKTGDVAVFFTTFVEDNTEYFNEYDISIESETYAHLCFIPKTGKVLLVDKYRDVSYAKSNENCYTLNGKLYIVDNNSLNIKRFEMNEYDTSTLKLRLRYADVPDKIRHDSFALIGDKLFYRNYREFDSLYGDIGGEMKVYDCQTGVTRKLFSYGDSLNRGWLQARGNELYCVVLWTNGYLDLELRDQATGTFLNYYKQYYFTDYNFYTDYEWLVALGDHSVFLLRGNSEKTELYRLTDTSIDFLLEVRSGGWPRAIDVDGSYVLLGFKNHLVIYNDDTNEVKKYEFDGSIIHPEILVVR